MVARNLRVLHEEGLLVIQRYSDFLPPEIRGNVATVGLHLEESLTSGLRDYLLDRAYKSYRDTTLMKASLCRDNPALFGSNIRLIQQLDRQLSLIGQSAGGVDLDVNRNCMRQYLWKTIAALAIAGPLAQALDVPTLSIYDNPEYGDFAAVATTLISDGTSQIGTESPVASDISLYQRVLKHLLSTAAPEVCVMRENDLLVFLRDRMTLADTRALVCRVSELVAAAGEEVAQDALQRELRRITELIREEIARVRRTRTGLWLPVEILSQRFSKARALFDDDGRVYREAREALGRTLGDSDQWVFALLRLFDPAQISDVEKELGKEPIETSAFNAEDAWWIMGDTSFPWYVRQSGVKDSQQRLVD